MKLFFLSVIFSINFLFYQSISLQWTSNSGCYRGCNFAQLTYFDLSSYSDNAFVVANLKISEYLLEEKYEYGYNYMNIIDNGVSSKV